MVMLASYTANLATMLVIDAQQSSGITSIKDLPRPLGPLGFRQTWV